MKEQEQIKDLKIVLLAKKGARKRLLYALDEFDEKQDSEKINKVKSAVEKYKS